MVDIASLQVRITSSGVTEARRGLDNLSSSARRTLDDTESAGASFKKLGAVLAGLGLAAAAKGFIEIADAMTLTEARMKMVISATDNLLKIQSQLITIAKENRTDYKELANLFTKLNDPLKQLGVSTRGIIQITDAFSKSMLVGGANVQEAASATRQFAQAMASGVLRGDEFNSIAEASPVIMQLLQKELKVTQGELRKMAEEGKLTAGVVGGALLNGFDMLQEKVKGIPPTVSGAMQNMKTDVAIFVDELNKSEAITASLSSAINDFTAYLKENKEAISNVASGLVDLTKFMFSHADNVAIAVAAYLAITRGVTAANRIMKIFAATTVTTTFAVSSTTAYLTGMSGAQVVATSTTTWLTRAMAGLNAIIRANPLIMAATVIAAGIYAVSEAMEYFTAKAKKATDAAKKFEYNFDADNANKIKNQITEINSQIFVQEKALKGLNGQAKTALQTQINTLKAKRDEMSATAAGTKIKDYDSKQDVENMKKSSAAAEAKKKAAEAAKKATSEAAKLAKEWADEEQKINLKVAQSTENKYVQDVLAAQKHYDERMAHYKNDAKKQVKLNEGLQADLAKIQKEATKDYEDELEKKAKIEAEWAVKIFDANQKLSDEIIAQNAKMYGGEQISEIDRWYEAQLEALGKLTAEIPMTTQQVDELITKIEQLRSLRITEQTLSFKIEKTFFKSFEDGLQEAIEDAFNGKLSIEKFFNTITNNLLKTLTGEVSSSIAGLFKGASLFGSETGGAPDFLSTVANMAGSISSDTTVQTAGGTIIDKLTGAITQQGSDIETISKIATSGGGGIGDIFGNLSNIQSIATLPQKYQSLVSFVQNPAGWMSNFGATTGGFTGDMAAGFSNWMAGGGSSSAGLGTGSLGGQVGYYGGGMAAGAGMGYAAGYIGDKIMGSQTQAANYAAIGGAIGSIVPVIGTAAGIAIGALIGGSIGTKKEDNKAIDIFKASSEGVTGQDRTTYKTKSWYGVKTDVSTQMFDEATAKSIQKVIESYDYMLNQLGIFDKIVVENQAFESVAKFVDEGITKAFLQATGQVNVDAVYTAWTEYAKSIDKTTQEAFATQIQALITTKRGYDEWYLNFTGDTTGALKFKADYLTKDLDNLKKSMGATGVTAADFAAKMDAAVKENFTPETIANWQALGQTIQASEEATRAYQTALAQNIATIDAIIEKSKGQDSTQQKYLKTIQYLTGITMNSISDIERVGNSLKNIPNITSDAINAFGSLADSIVSMKNKVESSVKSSIASVMPETVDIKDIKADYVKFFGKLPTTLEEWREQGEALITKIEGVNVSTQPLMSESDTLALLQSLISKTDKEVADILIPQVKSGSISMSTIDKVLGYPAGQAENFLKEHGGYTPEKPININITDEQLRIYGAYGEILKAAGAATQTTTTAIEDFTDSLRSLAEFGQEFSVWRLNTKGDTTGAIKLQLDYALEAVSSYEKQLGVTGINIDNYIQQMTAGSSAIPANAEAWENLGRSLMEATDLQKEYADQLKATKDSLDKIVTSFATIGESAEDTARRAFESTGISGGMMDITTFSAYVKSLNEVDVTPEQLESLQSFSEALGALTAEKLNTAKANIDAWKNIGDSITSTIETIQDKTYTFADVMNKAMTLENSEQLLSQLENARQSEIDKINEASTLRLKSLNKELNNMKAIMDVIKSIRSRIIDVLPANNMYYKTAIEGVRSGTMEASELGDSIGTYLDKFKEQSISKLEYIRESAKVQSEVEGLKGLGGAGRTLEDVEAAIKNEEEVVKSAIDAVNNTAIGILNGWQSQAIIQMQSEIDNANRIIAAINALGGSLATISNTSAVTHTDDQGRPTQIVGVTTAGLNTATNIDYYLPKPTPIQGMTREGEFTINGSHASGLDYVPFDGYMAELHRGERVKTKGQARQEDSERDSLKADIAELKAINIKNTAELMRMSKVITRADDGDALRVRVTA